MTTTNLCDVCSRLKLRPSEDDFRTRYLGLYEVMESKCLSLGPGLGGCGGCQFFCDVLRNSDNWSWRVSDLAEYVINFHSLSLEPRKIEEERTGTTLSTNDLELDVCTADNVSGEFMCSMSGGTSLLRGL
jgi:hypothetical protein